jgi:hypothetical protein
MGRLDRIRSDVEPCRHYIWTGADTFDFCLRQVVAKIPDHGLQRAIVPNVALAEQAQEHDFILTSCSHEHESGVYTGMNLQRAEYDLTRT